MTYLDIRWLSLHPLLKRRSSRSKGALVGWCDVTCNEHVHVSPTNPANIPMAVEGANVASIRRLTESLKASVASS